MLQIEILQRISEVEGTDDGMVRRKHKAKDNTDAST